MPNKKIEQLDIPITDLVLDLENPRYETQDSQREALMNMANKLGQKLVNLAEHIGKNGVNPADNLIVTKSSSGNRYVSLEGNRRLAAMKLATEPQLVDSLEITVGLKKKFKAISAKYGKNYPQSLQCIVFPTRESAKKWIELRHTGENDGVGIMPWNSLASARFRGASPATQALEMVKSSEYLDKATKLHLSNFPLTNLERVIKTPEVRELIGISISGNELHLQNGMEPKALGRLAYIVNDLASRVIKVTQLDSKEQRIKYAQAVVERPNPPKGRGLEVTKIGGTQTGSVKVRAKRQNTQPKRQTLIPNALSLVINNDRIQAIYDELKRLKLDKFPNSIAVLCRVFLEMSVDEYMTKNKIQKVKPNKNSNGTKPLTLKESTQAVIDDLIAKGMAKDDEKKLYGIKVSIGTKNSLFSVQNWNQYVHNQHYHPSASDLKTTWDNTQFLFECIWK